MCQVEISQLDRVDLGRTLVCLTLVRDTQRHTSRVVLIESLAVGRLSKACGLPIEVLPESFETKFLPYHGHSMTGSFGKVVSVVPMCCMCLSRA